MQSWWNLECIYMYYNNTIVPCSILWCDLPFSSVVFPPQADPSVGDDGSSCESDMESQPKVERDGERVTMETIHGWVQSATGKVNKQYNVIIILWCKHSLHVGRIVLRVIENWWMVCHLAVAILTMSCWNVNSREQWLTVTLKVAVCVCSQGSPLHPPTPKQTLP